MGKNLSLAGLIVAIIGAVVPIVGLFIGWIGLIFATIGAFLGGKGLAIATVAVSAVVFLFLTPSLWLEAAATSESAVAMSSELAGRDMSAPPLLKIVTLILLAAPIVGIVVGKKEQDA